MADEGGGKSTLSASVVVAGGSVCDDDFLVLRRDLATIVARGLRGVVSLRFCPDSRGALAPLLQMVEIRADRFVIPLSRIPTGWTASLVPQELWFLTGERKDESRIVRSLPFAEALARVIPATNSFLLANRVSKHVSEMVPLFTQLVEQCRSLEVSLGRDLLEEPSRVLRHLVNS